MGISSALRLVEIEGKGRGLVAAQTLKGGQIVMRDSPIYAYFAFPLKRRQQQEGPPSCSRYCDHCFRSLAAEEDGVSSSFPSCSSCDDAVFCSTKCQLMAGSSTHTPWVCRALSYLRNCPLLIDDQPEERQVEARCLVAAYNLAVVSPSSFQALLSLHGRGARHGEKGFDVALLLRSLISAVPFPEGFSLPSAEITADILAKDWCNSFCLMEPFSENGRRSVRAYAVYPNASLFNHDCSPNACRFDYTDDKADGNTDVIIRMIHDVPQGREVCISYFRVNLSYAERQKRLLNDFGFACRCDRCRAEKGDDNLSGSGFSARFLCGRENCGGTLAPLPPSRDGGPSDVVECNFCGNLRKGKALPGSCTDLINNPIAIA